MGNTLGRIASGRLSFLCSGGLPDIRADRIRPLVDWTRRMFPSLDTSEIVPWAGLRPMMPDMMPRVGAGARPGVFYNTGHGHLGWTLSAVTADLLTAAVEQAPSSRARRRPAGLVPAVAKQA